MVFAARGSRAVASLHVRLPTCSTAAPHRTAAPRLHVSEIVDGPTAFHELYHKFGNLAYREIVYTFVNLCRVTVDSATDVTTEIIQAGHKVYTELELLRRLAADKVRTSKRVLKDRVARRRRLRPRRDPAAAPGPPPGSSDGSGSGIDILSSGDDTDTDDEQTLPIVDNIGGVHGKVLYRDPRPGQSDRIWATQTVVHRGTPREAIAVYCHLHNCKCPVRLPHRFAGIQQVRRWVAEGSHIACTEEGRGKHTMSYIVLRRE